MSGGQKEDGDGGGENNGSGIQQIHLLPDNPSLWSAVPSAGHTRIFSHHHPSLLSARPSLVRPSDRSSQSSDSSDPPFCPVAHAAVSCFLFQSVVAVNVSVSIDVSAATRSEKKGKRREKKKRNCQPRIRSRCVSWIS